MRILALVNLRSGQADEGIYDFLRALGRAEAEIVLRFVGEKRAVASQVEDAKEFDRVVAVGGDGTVSGICYALRDTGVPIVVYPAGTANLTALNLGIPTDAMALADMTLRGAVRAFDMGELWPARMASEGAANSGSSRRSRGFIVAAGAGFDATIMEGARELKPVLGAAGYLVSALQNLTPQVAQFKLTLDGRTVDTEGIAVLIVNFAKLQFDLSITHGNDAADGLFEVVVLRTRNAVELIPAVWAMLIDRAIGSHSDRSAGLDVHQAREVLVEADPPLSLQFDGEVLDAVTPLAARILPGATTFVVPG